MIGNLMIFGDSYSTYAGMIPEGYAVYYSKEGRGDPEFMVTKMEAEDTWWMRLINATDATLVQNNSWSGSTVGYTGYSGDCSHTSSFIYRYRQLKERGFFKENRIIHNHLLDQAQTYNVPVIKTDTIEKSIEHILTIINKSCANIKLTNSVEELKDVIDIIINQNNGSIEKITYTLKGFKDPLVREVKVSDDESTKRFIENIEKNPAVKEDLTNLYNLSKYREFLVCAPNMETLENIEKELKQKGFVYNE